MSTAFQLAGLALVAVAGYLIVPWLGVLCVGIGLLLIGISLEVRDARKSVRTPRDS